MQDSSRPSCYSTKLIETDDPEATLGNWAVSGWEDSGNEDRC